jgi:hypothetical protein
MFSITRGIKALRSLSTAILTASLRRPVGRQFTMLIAMDADSVFDVEMVPAQFYERHAAMPIRTCRRRIWRRGSSTVTPLVHHALSLLQLFNQRLDPLLSWWIKSLFGEPAIPGYLLIKLLAFFAHGSPHLDQAGAKHALCHRWMQRGGR